MCFTLFSSCRPSRASSLKRQFGEDDSYFMALKALEQNDEKNAIRLFSKSAKKSNPKIARLAAENLTQLGNVTERNRAAKILETKYGDDEALLACAKVYFEQGEFSRILSMTSKTDLASAPEKLVLYRLKSLLKKKDPRLKDELFDWFTLRPLTQSHADFYAEYLSSLKGSETEKEIQNAPTASQLPPDIQLMNFRLLVYNKNYATAYAETKNILSLYENRRCPPHYQILSDIGKAALYGTKDYKTSAVWFESLAAAFVTEARRIISQTAPKTAQSAPKTAQSAPKTDQSAPKTTQSAPQTAQSAQDFYELAYCAYFYASRLYDKAGRYQEKVVQRFKSALDCTADPDRFDNALWYLLNMQLRLSTDDIISTLKKYSSGISKKSWFDDFFDNFSVLLLSHEKWQDFYDVWKLINSAASEETACKYAYISGRLLEEGFIETDGTPKTREAVAAYTRVLSGNSSLYYKVCAIERMNITDPAYVKDILCSAGTAETAGTQEKAGTQGTAGTAVTTETKPETGKNPAKKTSESREAKNARILLAGYAAYGFPQKIYPQWLKDREILSMEATLQASRFLNECGKFDSTYSVQSLRIASRTKAAWTGTIPYELLELNFPRFYSDFVKAACTENKLSEPVLYALIRSESFFDAKAGSSAGAQGLTQLMPSTAADEARKLKLPPDYDLLDPQTNIRLGSHYFAGLISRTENNSVLSALFAYNAGLTNVRRWKRPPKMPVDLFLEVLPFQETREYGRKLVGASAMYGFLYYGISPAQTVRELFK